MAQVLFLCLGFEILISVHQGVQYLGGHPTGGDRAVSPLLHHNGEGVWSVLIAQKAGKPGAWLLAAPNLRGT